jgi:hypothetical protein
LHERDFTGDVQAVHAVGRDDIVADDGARSARPLDDDAVGGVAQGEQAGRSVPMRLPRSSGRCRKRC